LSVHDVGLKDMIEAVYLMENKPDMHLVTISIKNVVPMTVELSEKVKKAIPETIEKIFKLTEYLFLEVS